MFRRQRRRKKRRSFSVIYDIFIIDSLDIDKSLLKKHSKEVKMFLNECR